MLQVIIPIIEVVSLFKLYGFNKSKYLLPLDVNLANIIEHAIYSLNITIDCKYFFIVNDHLTEVITFLNDICTKKSYNYEIIISNNLIEDFTSIVYEIINKLDINEPLLLSNADQILKWNSTKFFNKCQLYDSCKLRYNSSNTKEFIGIQYFKNAEYFINIYTHIFDKNLNIYHYDLDNDEHFYIIRDPNDYFNYLNNCGGYKMLIEPINNKSIIYKNNQVNIVYEIYNENIEISNKGFILLLEGNAKIIDNGVNNVTITKEMITTYNILTMNTCKFLHISYPELQINNTWNITNFTRGWLIGNFLPSIIKTTNFEVGLLTHKKDEKWAFHYHQYMTEINVLVSGSMKLNEKILQSNTIFTIYKNEIACPIFLEDCKILCIKVPSVVNDKVCI